MTQRSRPGLTKKQSEIYHFLTTYVQEHGYPPTHTEIQEHFGFRSTNAVHQFLKALERKGYIKRSKKRHARSIQILDPLDPHTAFEQSHRHPLPVQKIIIIGRGTAENPLSAFLNPQGQLYIDTTYFQSTAPLFAAYAPDSSLEDYGISPGDLLIAEQQSECPPNSIVIGLLHSQLFARYLIEKAGKYELKSNVKGYPPIPFSVDDSSIALLGRVIGTIRRFQ